MATKSTTALPAWLSRLARWLGSGRAPLAAGERSRRIYEAFRGILAINDRLLELFADLEELNAGDTTRPADALAHRMRRALVDTVEMARLLDLIVPGRYQRLFPVLRHLAAEIERILPFSRSFVSGPLVVRVDELRAARAHLAGTKMANLGEAWWGIAGLDVPDGFVITATAFGQFMAHNQLWDATDELEEVARSGDSAALVHTCHSVEQAIVGGVIPAEIEREVARAWEACDLPPDARVALRSSAVGEDRTATHAGQYKSILDVGRAELWDAYRRVVASTFAAPAVTYRVARGVPVWEASMAVGCLRMVEARCSGIMFSRDYLDAEADRVVLSVVEGLADAVAGGTRDAEELVLSEDGWASTRSATLDAEELARLWKIARLLEAYFKRPQDIEWAIDRQGQAVLLQSRPMNFAPAASPAPLADAGRRVLLEGGITACPGAAAGPVFPVHASEDLDFVPAGAVVVAHHAEPALSRVMRRAAGLITEVGSPTGHTAILAREFRLPCVVGMPGVLARLDAEQPVTLDAWRCRVLDGLTDLPPRHRLTEEPAVDADTQSLELLRQAAELITPLNLVDPTSRDFAPRGCRTLHDATRFIHEKLFEVMFNFGELLGADREAALALDADLPFRVRIYDLGGGLASQPPGATTVAADAVVSSPARSFLDGLLDARINWKKPRPVSTTGFLSVVGENLIGPPPEAQELGKTSFAVLSDSYMNFSTKAGYHFSMVDSYCSASTNKNYVHFRFAGGGASVGRRTRRVAFLDSVLRRLEFITKSRGDVLTAQLRRRDAERTRAVLLELGRLTMVTRQLDMLMDSDSSPEFFALAFLEGRLDVF